MFARARETRIQRLLWSTMLGAVMLLGAGCGELLDQEEDQELMAPVGVRVQDLQSVCSVPVRGYGTVDMESDYIPNVIACESASGSSLETLKAQAIAARTYAVFKLKVEGQREMINGQGNQVYKCAYATPQAIHRQAAQETAGQVITHNGLVTAAFYVAGAIPSTQTCIPSAQDIARNDRTNTERHVTYNEGRSGSNLRRARSPIGHPANPHNVGVLSQEGAKCLGARGRSAMGILRFYYGDGITLETMSGCSGSQPVTPEQPAPTTPNNDSGQCQTNDQAPTIVPRSGWGARSPRSNRPVHRPNRLTIHHTVQGTSSRGASAVRQVQNWHMNDRGWSDIGYHYLVDRDGTIYAGNEETRQGAHVLNQNSGNVGIALIGDFRSESPSSAQLNSVVRMVKYLSKKYSIPLNRTSIKGHGERMSTECPGPRVSVDRIVQMAGSDTICDEQPEETNTPNVDPEYEYELPDLQVEADLIGYKYLRITHTGEGGAFPVDGAYHEAGGALVWASSASGNAQNASAATGAADLTKCADLQSKAALIMPGGQLTLEFDKGLTVASGFFIRGQAVTSFPDECNEAIDGRANIEASLDGKTWDTLLKDSTSNTSASVPSMEFDFIKPEANTSPADAVFQVQASKEIVKVAYYAEKNPLGTVTTPGNNFELKYKFQSKGKRLISAWGYNAEGKVVAKVERYITITDGLTFIAPTEGHSYPPPMLMSVAANDDIKRVVYMADGLNLGESSDRSKNFENFYTFMYHNTKKLIAIGYNDQGQEVARAQVEILIDPNSSTLRFSSPRVGARYKKNDEVPFSVESTNAQIVRVQYNADGKFDLGSSSDKNSQYPLKYKFNQVGRRKIYAFGYSAEGQKVATASLDLIITDENGTIPDDGSNYDPNSDPNASGNGGANANSSLAERLARAAAVVDGRRSGGRCWSGVKTAFEAASVSRPSGYNGVAYSRLGGQGPCSTYNFQLSAYCFGRNASANPQTLFETFQMEEVHISHTQAIRGDVIVYDRGCVSDNTTAHRSHGHIEIALGDGRACSDYCGRIRTGGESCSKVFRPVSSRSN